MSEYDPEAGTVSRSAAEIRNESRMAVPEPEDLDAFDPTNRIAFDEAKRLLESLESSGCEISLEATGKVKVAGEARFNVGVMALQEWRGYVKAILKQRQVAAAIKGDRTPTIWEL